MSCSPNGPNVCRGTTGMSVLGSALCVWSSTSQLLRLQKLQQRLRQGHPARTWATARPTSSSKTKKGFTAGGRHAAAVATDAILASSVRHGLPEACPYCYRLARKSSVTSPESRCSVTSCRSGNPQVQPTMSALQQQEKWD